MRSLNKNKRSIYYALFVKDEPIYDEYGNETGESNATYGDITELRCNFSAASGEDAVQAFGNFTKLLKILKNSPIFAIFAIADK